MYKFKNGLLPKSCSDLVLLNQKQRNNDYVLRHVSEFKIPRFKTSLKEKSIKVRGPRLWTSLSHDLKNKPTLYQFKRAVQKEITKSLYF